MGAQACFDKMYAKFTYIRPTNARQPMDCKKVKFKNNPEIVFIIQRPDSTAPGLRQRVGIELHCGVPTVEGVGGVILLLQVHAFISWETEFLSSPIQLQFTPAPWTRVAPHNNSVPEELRYDPAAKLETVREAHAVFISIPMMYKIAGPRMLLMAPNPIYTKLGVYAAQIYNAFSKLDEVTKPLKLIQSFKNGFCPAEVKALEAALKDIENTTNALLRRVGHDGEGELVMKMRHSADGTGRFAGTRLA